MGVYGLYTFISDNHLYTVEDITQIFNEEDRKIEIMVDANSIGRFIAKRMLKDVVNKYSNEFLCIPIGEYDILSEEYTKFHNTFKNAGIELVWIVECTRPLNCEEFGEDYHCQAQASSRRQSKPTTYDNSKNLSDIWPRGRKPDSSTQANNQSWKFDQYNKSTSDTEKYSSNVGTQRVHSLGRNTEKRSVPTSKQHIESQPGSEVWPRGRKVAAASDNLDWPRKNDSNSCNDESTSHISTNRNHSLGRIAEKPSDSSSKSQIQSQLEISNKKKSQNDIEEFKERYIDSFDKNCRILQACQNQERLAYKDGVPEFNFEIGLEKLKEVGATIIKVLPEDPNNIIIRMYRERGTYAIMTNNSDFVIFENCRVIFPTLIFKKGSNKPLDYILRHIPITSQSLIMEKLMLEKHDQLLILGTLRSRFLSKQYSRQLLNFLELPADQDYREILFNMATFIKTTNISLSTFEEIKGIKEFMNETPENKGLLRILLKHYYQEYPPNNVNGTNESQVTENCKTNLTTFLLDQVKSGKATRSCYSIHNGTYFPHLFFRLTQSGKTVDSDIMSDIRSEIYPYLLNRSQTSVSEWRSNSFEDIKVTHSEIQTDQIDGETDGIKIFEKIWSHKETNSLEYMKTFDRETAFILYILRYFYQINNKCNLHVTTDQFDALFVTVFYQCAISRNITFEFDLEWFMKMKICPSPQCLSIATWFMDIYYNAKYICGGALNITEFIPPPASIMSGSTFIAIYETTNGNTERVANISEELKSKLRNLKIGIIKMFNNEYLKVIE